MNKILGFNTDGSSRKEGGINKDGKGCYAVLQIRKEILWQADLSSP